MTIIDKALHVRIVAPDDTEKAILFLDGIYTERPYGTLRLHLGEGATARRSSPAGADPRVARRSFTGAGRTIGAICRKQLLDRGG